MSKARNELKQQRLGDDGLKDRLGPPHKRRMTDKSSPEETSTAAGASSVMMEPGETAAVNVTGNAEGDVERNARAEKGKSDTSKSVEPEMPQVDRLFSDRVVTILVGPHEVKWCLHENLLSGVSDFFKSAFNSGFRESIEGKITMPEDDPHAFELFVRWLYIRAVTPELVASSTASASVLLGRHVTGGSGIKEYLRLYVLASKLLIEDLENLCVDMAYAYYGVGMRRPEIRDVQYIYENTMPASGMRKLMRERLTLGLFRGRQHNPVTAEWREIMNETPDLGFDIVNEVASYSWIAGGNAPARAVADECSYHRHSQGQGCMRL